MNYGYLASPDLPEHAVHVLPLGAVEPHGPHAPLVTDTLISIGVCHRAAARLEGEIPVLVLPPVHYGVTRYAAAFPGVISISEGTLRSLVTEIAESVGPLVLVNNHFEPEQVETLRATGLPLLDLTRRRNAERLTEEFRSGSCHAGRYETSLVLADRQELVHTERMTALEERHVDMPAEIRAGRTDFVAMGMTDAYCGDPAESSAEEGLETFETLTEMLVELIREVAA
ncbi:MAG TPA: creatininase family protein [Gaiellaceae bacterium]|nr:creatininase family protein [Gaiellaceae bacterium]